MYAQILFAKFGDFPILESLFTDIQNDPLKILSD